LIAVALVAPLAAGCAAGGTTVPLTPSQREAIESRTVDAPSDATFRAAAGVLMDRGAVITMSDASAGLVAGRQWGFVYCGQPCLYCADHTLVWVRRAGPARSELRVQMIGGSGSASADAVTEFARQVSERTMMAAPSRSSP
jgi:hypothetical protein